MFEATWARARTVATIGIAAALVVAGLAVADEGGQGQSGSEAPQAKAGKRPPPPTMMGPGLKGLTYGELHIQDKEGKAETIRLDQGKIVSVGSDSLTLTENDGSEVTVAVDSGTEVMAGPPGPGKQSLDDLEAGQQVLVCGPEGEAARSVTVVPEGGAPRGAPTGGQLPPPPGAQMGS